ASSPEACRFAPGPRPSDNTWPSPSASKLIVFVPPASMPRTCTDRRLYASLARVPPTTATHQGLRTNFGLPRLCGPGGLSRRHHAFRKPVPPLSPFGEGLFPRYPPGSLDGDQFVH